MSRPALSLSALLALAALLAGCATQPEDTSDNGPAHVPTPAKSAEKTTPANASPTERLEERHRKRAQAYTDEGNLADALVQWELLMLLQPNHAAYRDAAADARARIAKRASALLQTAEQARKQGNLDQAELMYLRVLNVDRDNAVAAQALRDLEAERTRRAYSNRPPRMKM